MNMDNDEEDEGGLLLRNNNREQELRERRQNPQNEGGGFLSLQWTCILICCILALVVTLVKHFEDAKERERQFLLSLLHDKVEKEKNILDDAEEEEDGGMKSVLITEDGSKVDLTLEDANEKQEEAIAKKTQEEELYYLPNKQQYPFDPFHLQKQQQEPPPDWYGSYFVSPPYPTTLLDNNDDDDSYPLDDNLGFIQSPSIHNNTIVFTTEGDLYLSYIPSPSKKLSPLPAMKLTTTIGNILSPKINPYYPNLIAFTATYTGRREVYLLDTSPLKRSQASVRLTYTDSNKGIDQVINWADEGKSIIVCTKNLESGLPDYRLYKIWIFKDDNGDDDDSDEKQDDEKRKGESAVDSTTTQPSAFQQQQQQQQISNNDAVMEPIPLSQAIDGFYSQSCFYFTRTKQSSNTIRYRGGTAQNLWMYCNDQDYAVGLTKDYDGTSKSPHVWSHENVLDGKEFLLFLSDRYVLEESEDEEKWGVGSMNLWAMPLPTHDEIYGSVMQEVAPIQLTSIYCQYNGMPLSEYTIDYGSKEKNVVLRIGADLHMFQGEDVARILKEAFGNEGEEKGKKTRKNNRRDLEKKSKKKKNKHKDDIPSTLQAAADKSPVIFPKPSKLPIVVYSDFNNMNERTIPITIPSDLSSVDIYQTSYKSISVLLNVRGQLYVAPTIEDTENEKKYDGAGMNIPPRRYRVAPGSTTGGMIRILASCYIPPPPLDKEQQRRHALILATDPASPHAEHALYIIPTDAGAKSSFVNVKDLPKPLWGGHLNGGSTSEGGLGSIDADSLTVSPCGRRVAWTDKDGRIAVVPLPIIPSEDNEKELVTENITVLPKENENGEPMIGIDVDLTWSPGGRYLAIEHAAKNQFSIISIADLGDPNDLMGEDEGSGNSGSIRVGRIVQATPDRFNSEEATWGFTGRDSKISQLEKMLGVKSTSSSTEKASTLYFMSDRDVVLSDPSSPWGTRAPSPHFPKKKNIYALPLQSREKKVEDDPIRALYPGLYLGGGGAELMSDSELKLKTMMGMSGDTDGETKDDGESESKNANGESRRLQRRLWDDDDDDDNVAYDVAIEARQQNSSTSSPTSSPSPTATTSSPTPAYPSDTKIEFGAINERSLSFARRAYRLSHIPAAHYISILCQISDDPSLVLVERGSDGKSSLVIFAADTYPGDGYTAEKISVSEKNLEAMGISTGGDFIYVVYGGKMKVIPNTAGGVVSVLMKDVEFNKNIVDTTNFGLSVWPSLEYQQMYADAWRMMRDYFYDPGMTGINWNEIFDRYLSLVKRCAKREELDEVLKLMASEVSALHVFVYGGEYPSPLHGSQVLDSLSEIGSLGAVLRRSLEWNGYVVMSVLECDPDFGLLDGQSMYSPLSDRTLQMSGQRGLEAGDVIVGVNGENIMAVPDIGMLLRGTSGRSVRLEVLRVSSGALHRPGAINQIDDAGDEGAKTGSTANGIYTSEPLIVVPISGAEADKLRYASWEWKTREAAKSLAREAGFTVGYIHLQSMSGAKAEDAFVRSFYPDYDKQALIIDVRHNTGGNIDSWLLDVLQRRAWLFWEDRATNITTGGTGWDEQFAFRGHIVVLINEHTSSDGEGFSRGMSELGLGKLVGTRTWGGGIWLSSDNNLVDDGIATAPEIGQYNNDFGWGLGIEMVGVTPDMIVDNNPRRAYDGKDEQLEEAINILKEWLKEEPVVLPKDPGPHRDNSFEYKCEAQN